MKVLRRLRIWLRARRIAYARGLRLEREWQADQAAFELYLDGVERRWWKDRGREIFGA